MHCPASLQIPGVDFSKDPNVNQYVYLKAQFPDADLEKLVLVTFQSGYIYIQTDKTLYIPNSKGVSSFTAAEQQSFKMLNVKMSQSFCGHVQLNLTSHLFLLSCL